jgi:cellulose synthase/poly-beta-1,6-N-acetylglucosamine synthase-like glycosyltransferase
MNACRRPCRPSRTLSHTTIKISVIIPAYNEKAFIEEILRRVASNELGYITE